MSRIERSVKGWVKSGCGMPVVATVQNWSPVKHLPGYCHARDARWVVVVKYADFGCQDLYYGEFDSRKEAERSARAVNGWITRYYNKYSAQAA